MKDVRRGLLALLIVGLAAAWACGDAPAPVDPDAPEAPPPPEWSLMATPTEAQLLGVWGRTSSEAYAVGWDGTVLRWDGIEWLQETSTATVPLTDVAGPPEPELGPVYAVGWGGVLLERQPDGRWIDAVRTTSTTRDLFGVHFLSETEGAAVGEAGTVLRWDGLSWVDVDFAVTSELSGELVQPRTTLSGVWGVNERWFFTGAGGSSYRSQRLESFEALDTRESVPLRGVWGSGAGNVYCVGLDGLVLRLTNRWRRQSSDLPRNFLFGVWGRDADDLTVVGWRGTIGRWVLDEWRLERPERVVDLRDVWVDAPSGFALAVGARGTILTRTASVTL